MSEPGDERLELDELGAVIDDASMLSSPANDLLEGNDLPTWTERLGTARATTWLNRHRYVVAIAVIAALVVGGVGVVWRRSILPPPDQTLFATLVEGEFADFAKGDVRRVDKDTLQSLYLLSNPRDGETGRIEGVAGPGIGSSSIEERTRDGAVLLAGMSLVTATVGCVTTALAPDPRDFRIRVAQVDRYGRVVHLEVPAPVTSAIGWAQRIKELCAEKLLPALVTAAVGSVHVDTSGRTVSVELRLHNTSDRPIYAFELEDSIGAQHISASSVRVDAGGTGRLVHRQRVIDCSASGFDRVVRIGSSGAEEQVTGAVVRMSLQDGRDDTVPTGSLGVPWPEEVDSAVSAGFTRICAGTPATSVRVIRAGRSNADQVSEFPDGPSDGALLLRLTLEVVTAADRVVVGDSAEPEDLRTGRPRVVTTAPARVDGGRARVTVDWLVQCQGVTQPPVVGVRVAQGRRAWPVLTTLSQAPITRAYSAACPEVTPQDLRDSGWEGVGTR